MTRTVEAGAMAVSDEGRESQGGTDAWDQPGRLAIVVQGGLFRDNLVEVANHCRHWRTLFPQAEIVLSLSVTDVVAGSCRDGRLLEPRLVERHAEDGLLQGALAIILASCDVIALAEPALPLPPIKSDTPKLNNVNLQIAAARNGLAKIASRYVLRVRSDLLFLDRNFLDQFAESVRLPRGGRAVFRERVLISWLYTLNPYTVERMPFSFSDWFNFGLTDDVRRLWDVPPMTFADSVFFQTRDHAPDSNLHERRFYTRLAVEQHIVFGSFSKVFDDIQLDYNNDMRSAEASLEILSDNFALCDVVLANCLFPKYAHEFRDTSKTYHCLTRQDWLAMVADRDLPFTQTLAGKVEAARAAASSNAVAEFPKHYPVGLLKVGAGRLSGGMIVSTGGSGPLFFGPYATLSGGSYVAHVQVASVMGTGLANLSVTMEDGKRGLARHKATLEVGREQQLSIPFRIVGDRASGVEIVCHIEGAATIAVSGLTIERALLEPTTLFDTARTMLRNGRGRGPA